MAARTPWHRMAGPERAAVANPTEIPGFDPPLHQVIDGNQISAAAAIAMTDRPKWGLVETGGLRLFPPLKRANDAEFSPDGRCRYWLTRIVEVGMLPYVGLFIGLNPSKAGAVDNDQTIRKEIGFASRWGWSGFWKANLFAHVETESALLRELAYDYAVGDRNDDCLKEMVARAPEIVLCWGDSCPPMMRIRIAVVLGIVQKFKPHSCQVFTLGLTTSGQPRHTSRIGYDTARVPWRVSA